MKIQALLAAASLAAVSFAATSQAYAQAAAAPAAPPVSHGPVLAGVCILSLDGAIGGSTVGKYVQTRLGQIGTTAQSELTAEQTAISNEAKALDAKKATLAQDALEQQASALQVKANAWQRKGQLRQKEVEATEQKALARVYQELDTPIRQVYQAQKCSILFDRESVMLANPAMDITGAVVTALDARIKTLTFDRERLDQGAPGAAALQPTNK